MKKKFLMYLGGISFCILSLLFSYQTDVGINTTLRTESAELGDLKSQDFLIPLPVLEVEERGDEFLISLTEEAVDSLEAVSCAIVGWDKRGYYPILYGREVFLDENRFVHISKEQSVVTLFFEDIDQPLPLTKMYERQDEGGIRTWYSTNFFFSSTENVSESYYVHLDLSETGATNRGYNFLNCILTPTSQEIYNPAIEKVAYEYWNYVNFWDEHFEEVYNADGGMLPASEWVRPWNYLSCFSYSGHPDELIFQLMSVHEIPGVYYCQMILELKDGRVTASDLMPLQKDGGDTFVDITKDREETFANIASPDFSENVEIKTEQGILYFEVYKNYAILNKYLGEDVSIDIPEKVNDVFVTEVGQKAFESNFTLQEVHLPSELIRIDEWAFYGTNLVEIHLPDKLKYIGYEAFGNKDINSDAVLGTKTKTEIESVRIGKDVLWVGDGAFSGYCIRNFDVDSENSYYRSKDGVIYSKDQTCLLACPTGKNGELQVLDGVVKVSPAAFQNNGLYNEIVVDSYGIQSIILPDSVRTFACHQLPEHLESLEVGKGLEKWDYRSVCPVLSKLNISEDNPNYYVENGLLYNGDRSELLFYSGTGGDEIVYLPEGLKVILDNAFLIYDSSVAAEVHIPEGVHTIGKGNFSGIIQRDSWDVIHVYLPDSLTEIGIDTFCKSPGIVIHASEDSYGASYAKKHEIQLEVE